MTDTVSTKAPRALSVLRSPALALALAALFWSGNFVAGRALRGQVDPVTLNFLRWLIALAVIAPFVWQSMAMSLKVLRREWRLILALGATGIASFHILVYLALQSTTATNALLMLSLAPIATLFGSTALGVEVPTRQQTTGALISIVGAGLLITRGSLSSVLSQGFNRGDLFMLVARCHLGCLFAHIAPPAARFTVTRSSHGQHRGRIGHDDAFVDPLCRDAYRNSLLVFCVAERRLHRAVCLRDCVFAMVFWRVAAGPGSRWAVRAFNADLRHSLGFCPSL